MATYLNEKQIQAMGVVDPRIDVNRKVKWVLGHGSPMVSYNQFNSNNNSNTLQQIVPTITSVNSIIDRDVEFAGDIKVIVAGTSTGSNNILNFGNGDALRKNPFQRNVSAMNLKINGNTQSITPSAYINNIAWYESDKLEFTKGSVCPSYRDRYAEYNQYLTYGSVKNALGDYGDADTSILRGAYKPYSIDYNVSTGASVNFKIQEPLQISPLKFGLYADKGFVGVDTFEIDLQFSANQQMILSHQTGAGALSTITSASWSFNSAPNLVMTQRDANNLVAPINPSKTYYYELLYPVISQTSVGNVAANATFNVNSAVVQLTSIPRSVLIMAKEINAQAAGSVLGESIISTDTCAYMTQLNIQWMNTQNMFSSATPQDLYRVAVKNNYAGSWLDWSVFNGSPLLLHYGEDIYLNPGEAPSLKGKYQLQLNSSSFTSLYPTRTVNFQLYLVNFYEGLMAITRGSASTNTSVLDQIDVLNSQDLPMVDKNSLMSESNLGGSFFDTIKSFFSSTLPAAVKKGYELTTEYAPKVLHAAESALPYVQQAERLASEYGKLRKGKGLEIGGDGGRMRHGRHRLRGRGFCEEQGQCGHRECEGEGGCIACEGHPTEVGRMSKDDLRSRLMGHGFTDNCNIGGQYEKDGKKYVDVEETFYF